MTMSLTPTMTPEAKGALSKTIRALRERLLADLDDAMVRAYKLGTPIGKARLDDLQSRRRARLDAWVDEQVRADGTVTKPEKRAEAAKRFRHDVVKRAAYTLLNRVVYLRLLEASGLRKVPLVTGGWSARGYQDFRDLAPDLTGDETEGYAHLLGLVFDELALDLPGLYGSAGIADLVPTPAATLRHLIETLDDPQLESCWTDDMTLGWVYQYWNDPEREALDAKLNAGGPNGRGGRTGGPSGGSGADRRARGQGGGRPGRRGRRRTRRGRGAAVQPRGRRVPHATGAVRGSGRRPTDLTRDHRHRVVPTRGAPGPAGRHCDGARSAGPRRTPGARGAAGQAIIWPPETLSASPVT